MTNSYARTRKSLFALPNNRSDANGLNRLFYRLGGTAHCYAALDGPDHVGRLDHVHATWYAEVV